MEHFASTLIIATGPLGFPGAGQIMSQTLRELARVGCRVVFVGKGKPFLFGFIDANGITFEAPHSIVSDAIVSGGAVPSEDVLLSHVLAERMTTIVQNQYERYQTVVLWGTYLFPYGFSALLSAETLAQLGYRVRLWVTPAGSDIWQIGPQLQATTKHVLSTKTVTNIITYTEQFSQEIKLRYTLDREISIIYPIIDFARFHPRSELERNTIRRDYHIDAMSFVITSHSNMRPVKCPEDVIYMARSVAQRIPTRSVTLLMIGPNRTISEGSIPAPSNLRILWTGVLENVEKLLSASDVELNCSWHDSFNLSLAEAMASGVPCVSTDVVGIRPEIVKSGGGFVFPYEKRDLGLVSDQVGRYHDAIAYISSLAESEELRKTTGERAHRHATQVFSASEIIPKYLDLL